MNIKEDFIKADIETLQKKKKARLLRMKEANLIILGIERQIRQKKALLKKYSYKGRRKQEKWN